MVWVSNAEVSGVGFHTFTPEGDALFDDPPSQLWVPAPGVEFGERLGLYLSHFSVPSLSFCDGTVQLVLRAF